MKDAIFVFILMLASAVEFTEKAKELEENSRGNHWGFYQNKENK